jgi:hypothetical protein
MQGPNARNTGAYRIPQAMGHSAAHSNSRDHSNRHLSHPRHRSPLVTIEECRKTLIKVHGAIQNPRSHSMRSQYPAAIAAITAIILIIIIAIGAHW